MRASYHTSSLFSGSHATFCTDSCSCPIMSLYSSGFRALVYLCPPDSVNLSYTQFPMATSLPNDLHSAIMSPKGSTIIEHPLLTWSSSMPIGFVKTTYIPLSYALEGSHFISQARPFNPSNSLRRDVGSFSLFSQSFGDTNPAPGLVDGVPIVTWGMKMILAPSSAVARTFSITLLS